MPATMLKNKVMYRQFIHSVAFVNEKCCTCLRPFIFTLRTCLVRCTYSACLVFQNLSSITASYQPMIEFLLLLCSYALVLFIKGFFFCFSSSVIMVIKYTSVRLLGLVACMDVWFSYTIIVQM